MTTLDPRAVKAAWDTYAGKAGMIPWDSLHPYAMEKVAPAMEAAIAAYLAATQPQAGEPMEPLGADFEAVWDKNVAGLYESDPASPQPANPAQVTDAMVSRASAEYQEIFGKYLLSSHARRILSAAIGAGGQAVAEPIGVVEKTGGIRWFNPPIPIGTKLYTHPPHPADERVVEAAREIAARAYVAVGNPAVAKLMRAGSADHMPGFIAALEALRNPLTGGRP